MTMENDLVERLRATADLGNNIYNPWPQVRLNEAASRIQALEAELARKTEALRGVLTKIEARKDRSGSGYYDASFHDGDLREARAALTEQS